MSAVYAGRQPTPELRRVRLFRNGRNQAVRIPVEFELPGDDAIMHRDGDRLVIEPVRKRGLVALLKTMKPLDEDFPNRRSLPAPEQVFDPLHAGHEYHFRRALKSARQSGKADRRAGEVNICTSIIVAAELRYGCAKAVRTGCAGRRRPARMKAMSGRGGAHGACARYVLSVADAGSRRRCGSDAVESRSLASTRSASATRCNEPRRSPSSTPQCAAVMWCPLRRPAITASRVPPSSRRVTLSPRATPQWWSAS